MGIRRDRDGGTGPGSGFARLWVGTAVSQAGTAVGAVVLPVLAVVVVHASTLEVSLLAMLGAATALLSAFPLGAVVEFRQKRATMVMADVVRAVAEISVPVTAALGHVTYLQLCVVAVVNAAGNVCFNAAAQAHLVDLVGRAKLVEANSRLQSTNWLSLSVGPFVAGALIAVVGAPRALLVDAVSFAASAVAVATIATREGDAVPRPAESRWRSVTAGLGVVRSDAVLGRLLLSWIVFAGSVGMVFPLETVFFLRDLHFSVVQYGAIYGVASVGGFAGSLLTHAATRRLGTMRTLWIGSGCRAALYFAIVASPAGPPGLVVCMVSMTAILLLSAVVNTTTTSYRQARTPDHLMVRVGTLWAVSTTAAQPVLIVLGGAIAAMTDTRVALLVGAVLIAASVLLLPRRGSAVPAARAGRSR